MAAGAGDEPVDLTVTAERTVEDGSPIESGMTFERTNGRWIPDLLRLAQHGESVGDDIVCD